MTHMTKRARNRTLAHLNEEPVDGALYPPVIDDDCRPVQFAWVGVVAAAVIVCAACVVMGVAALTGGWLR